MILAAALLVLLGLGLFVGGVLTGATALYWGCVAVCVVAAVLLLLARRRIFAETPARTPATSSGEAVEQPAAAGRSPAAAEGGTTAGADGPADASAASHAPASHAPAGPAVPATDAPDPAVEDVEVTDLLMVVDLKDEVLVVDEHPRYHLEGCAYLTGRTTIPLPIDEARTDGFTPCALCEPDRNLAQRARARKAGRGS